MSSKLIGPVLQYTCSFIKFKEPIKTKHSLFLKEIGLVLTLEATTVINGVIIDVHTSSSTSMDYVVDIAGHGYDVKCSDALSNDKTRSKIFPFFDAKLAIASSDSVHGSASTSTVGRNDDLKYKIKFNLIIKLDTSSGDDYKSLASVGTCFAAYEAIMSSYEDAILVASDGEVRIKKELLRIRSPVFASLLDDGVDGHGHGRQSDALPNHNFLDAHNSLDGVHTIDGINDLDNVLNGHDDDGGHHNILKPMVKVSGNETRIEMIDFKRKVLSAFVKFMKTDKIGATSGVAMDLFVLGHRFNIPLLKRVAGKVMITDVDEEDKERVFDLILNHEPTLLKDLYYDNINNVSNGSNAD